MTQDCSDSPSTADVSSRLPKGIHVVGTERLSVPRVEGTSLREPPADPGDTPKKADPATLPTSWSYLLILHQAAKSLHRWLERYNAGLGATARQPFFVHQTYRYSYKDRARQQGVKKVLEPTVSGLVFLQGTVKSTQAFLAEYFPQYHLVNDCSKGRPASIADSTMQPFMNMMRAHPEQVTFLRAPFEKFAKDHVRLRVLTGPFKGYEGYIVRIDRDRQLVFDFGGYAVAIRGVHNEDFEVVE